MDTAEGTNPPVGAVYDGFISYSHAADDLLAPRLQAGLQRFAKPWWKRRAVRIFRDESSLSANPHLWSSITEAMDTSGWFVLLLSPDAANSEWVNQEIEYWVENRDTRRILPVVTDGSFGWADDAMTGSAVPEALHGVFGEEPRWVDMRWAKGEEQLDLQDPRFADAIADIASAIREVPKDELASEEVRQHRRTVRTAWAAGGLVTILAIAAGGFGLQSARNADEAERQALIAQGNATEAQRLAESEAAARDTAEESAAEARASAEAEADARADAEEQRSVAEEAATLARSREVAATALEVLDDDPELATLLALESMSVAGGEPPGFLVDVVWEAALANRLTAVLRPGEGIFASLALSQDGSLLITSDEGGTATLFSAPDGEEIWSVGLAPANAIISVAFHPDGDRIAVSVADPQARDYSGDTEAENARPNEIVILDAADGTELDSLVLKGCLSSYTHGWSPDGAVLSVSSGWDLCPREGTSGTWLEVLDGESLEPLRLFNTDSSEDLGPIEMNFSDAGDLFVSFLPGNDPILLEAPDYETARTLDGVGGNGAISPDGSLVATFSNTRFPFAAVFDAETLQQRDALEPPTFVCLARPYRFSPDGTFLALSSEGRDTLVYAVESGSKEFRLPGGPSCFMEFSPDSRWLYTSHFDGTVKVWDLGPRVFGQTGLGGIEPGWIVNGEFSIGPDLGAGRALASGPDGFDVQTLLFDLGTGEIVNRLDDAYSAAALADGRFVIMRDDMVLVHDPAAGDEVMIAGCMSVEDGICLDTGEPLPPLDWIVSMDRTEIMFINRETGGWYTASLEDGRTLEAGTFELPGRWPYEFTGDWILSSPSRSVWTAVDRETGEEIAVLETGDMRYRESSVELGLIAGGRDGNVSLIDLDDWSLIRFDADFDRVRRLAFSPSGELLVVGGENVIVIVDVATQEQIRTLPIEGTTAYRFLDEHTLLIGGGGPQWFSISLDPGDLASDAAAGLTRSFTERECRTYRIDPCPTLEELRNG
jgi:WD40 repeat protein